MWFDKKMLQALNLSNKVCMGRCYLRNTLQVLLFILINQSNGTAVVEGKCR